MKKTNKKKMLNESDNKNRQKSGFGNSPFVTGNSVMVVVEDIGDKLVLG
jgi:hypothetical protein